MSTTTYPVVWPCPSWCTEPAGHPFDVLCRLDEPFRIHNRDLGTAGSCGVDILAAETLVDGEAVLTEPPHILVSDADRALTADDAGELALLLQTAATQLRAITQEGGR